MSKQPKRWWLEARIEDQKLEIERLTIAKEAWKGSADAYRRDRDHALSRVEELEAKLYRKDERIKAWKQSSDEHEARVEALEGDLNIMRLQRDATHVSHCPKCKESERLIERLQTRDERLRAALKKYGMHREGCGWTFCKCGLAKTIEENEQ